ncbi:MAG: hypothetical protein ING51_12935, partial [Rhodocyclaceae bacterium]|nr:hypothetical protein [Rhodocyclaceae bacterium]
MTTDNSDETFGPTDGDALEILAFLRSRVREYGFADADVALEMRLMDLGISAGNEALREYCHGFDSYMSVFEPESIGRTEELFSTNLSGGFSWRLLRGGDVERTSRFIDRDSIVVEDL